MMLYFYQTKEVFSDVTKQLRSVKGVELSLANRVYIHQGAELNAEFAAVSRDVFNSDVKNVDFSKNVEAAKEINDWVKYFFYAPLSKRLIIKPSFICPDSDKYNLTIFFVGFVVDKYEVNRLYIY